MKIKWGCFWSHDFGKWELCGEGNLTFTTKDGHKTIVGSFIDQRRICKRCNFREINSQTTRL